MRDSGRRVLPRRPHLSLVCPAGGESDLPTEGKNLLVVARVDDVLHFRLFDGAGNVEDAQADDSRLMEHSRQLESLTKQVDVLWPPHELRKREKRRVVSAVTRILGYNLPRHWIFRVLGRMAIVVAAFFYVLVVFLAQYTSWGGARSIFEQHAFLLPAPFFDL